MNILSAILYFVGFFVSLSSVYTDRDREVYFFYGTAIQFVALVLYISTV